MGNICRSPTAQAVFEKLLSERDLSAQYCADSAGTHAYHVGHAPDARSSKAALERGIDMSRLRARQVADADFCQFDLLLAMDTENLHNLRARASQTHAHKVRHVMEFAARSGLRDVPDPYYGDGRGFELVLDLLHEACAGLLDALESERR